MVERKAARGPLTMSSGTGRWGRGADKDVHMYAETCKICTILATLMHTTRLGSSEVYDDLCNLCANSVASVHRVDPHWEIVCDARSVLPFLSRWRTLWFSSGGV